MAQGTKLNLEQDPNGRYMDLKQTSKLCHDPDAFDQTNTYSKMPGTVTLKNGVLCVSDNNVCSRLKGATLRG